MDKEFKFDGYDYMELAEKWYGSDYEVTENDLKEVIGGLIKPEFELDESDKSKIKDMRDYLHILIDCTYNDIGIEDPYLPFLEGLEQVVDDFAFVQIFHDVLFRMWT